MSQSLVTHGISVSSQDWRAAASYIDHTLLVPEATAGQIERHCLQAAEFGFASVLIHPQWLPLAVALLKGTGVRCGVPVGFPLGATFTSVKRFETEEALRLGAAEVDMVMNLGALRSGDRLRVQQDISGVAQVTRAHGALLKVVIETCLLNLEEKILACQICLAAGADFVKTSTGFSLAGATPEDVALMRGVVGEKMGVKASGGIRTAADLQTMLQAGANRIGTSAGPAIVQEMGAESR